MNTALIALLLVAAVTNVILLVTLLLRSSSNQGFAKEVREDLRIGREELRYSNKQANDTVAAGVHSFTEMGRTLDSRVNNLQETTEAKLEATRGVLDRIRDTVDAKLDTVRQELATGLKKHSDTLVATLDRTGAIQVERLEAMTKQVKEAGIANQAALDQIRATFDTRVEELRQSLDARVKEMQDGNERKLEEMRQTVDEKLQGTLEKRLGESFKFVSDRLEMVHQGLGEMQGLASGVGDLKRIFSNVKVRGTYAEVQLGSVLDQMLTPDQWSKNVCVKEGSLERVEFAIRLPGSRDDASQCMWLPIDSKFPTEDYARLQSASEAGDAVAVQTATDALLRALRAAAKDIHDKYVNPPHTTDYAIMFLATEGLYAEAFATAAIRRGDPAEVPDDDRGTDDALGDCQQPADGVSDARGREAGERGMASARRGEDGVWQVRWGTRQGGSSARYGDAHDRGDRGAYPGNGEAAARGRADGCHREVRRFWRCRRSGWDSLKGKMQRKRRPKK